MADERQPPSDVDRSDDQLERDGPPRRTEVGLYSGVFRPAHFIFCLVFGLAAAIASGFALAGLGWSADAATGFAYALPILPALFLLAFPFRTTMTVGADGLHLCWLGRGQFISYADIESIAYDTPSVPGRWPSHYVEIRLRSGKKHHYPGGREPVDALVAQATRAHEAYQQKAPPPAGALEPLRGAAVAERRIEELLRMGSGAAHPRTAPIHRDTLWRVLESPAASEADRGAAAVALGSEASDPDRLRLRVASDATANPRLRFVFDQAAAAEAYDDEEMAAALVELEQRRAADGRAADD